jgi:hypothetical protein
MKMGLEKKKKEKTKEEKKENEKKREERDTVSESGWARANRGDG